MKYRVVTYKTVKGLEEIVRPLKSTSSQWVVYQDEKPKYYVDFFDIKVESNAIMNSLVICDEKPIQEVLKIVNKNNNVRLSIPRASSVRLKLKTEYTDLELQPVPQEWLDYYLYESRVENS